MTIEEAEDRYEALCILFPRESGEKVFCRLQREAPGEWFLACYGERGMLLVNVGEFDHLAEHASHLVGCPRCAPEIVRRGVPIVSLWADGAMLVAFHVKHPLSQPDTATELSPSLERFLKKQEERFQHGKNGG